MTRLTTELAAEVACSGVFGCQFAVGLDPDGGLAAEGACSGVLRCQFVVGRVG